MRLTVDFSFLLNKEIIFVMQFKEALYFHDIKMWELSNKVTLITAFNKHDF